MLLFKEMAWWYSGTIKLRGKRCAWEEALSIHKKTLLFLASKSNKLCNRSTDNSWSPNIERTLTQTLSFFILSLFKMYAVLERASGSTKAGAHKNMKLMNLWRALKWSDTLRSIKVNEPVLGTGWWNWVFLCTFFSFFFVLKACGRKRFPQPLSFLQHAHYDRKRCTALHLCLWWLC